MMVMVMDLLVTAVPISDSYCQVRVPCFVLFNAQLLVFGIIVLTALNTL